MIDPMAHEIADVFFNLDKNGDQKNLGYIHYFQYAIAALEYLRKHGVKDVY